MPQQWWWKPGDPAPSLGAGASRGRSGLVGHHAPAPAAAPRGAIRGTWEEVPRETFRGGGPLTQTPTNPATTGQAPPWPDRDPASRSATSRAALCRRARPLGVGGGHWARGSGSGRSARPSPPGPPAPARPRAGRGRGGRGRAGGRAARAAAEPGRGSRGGGPRGKAGVGGLPGGGGGRGGRGAMCERAARLCRAGAHRLLREPPPQGRALGGLLRWVGARMGEPRVPLVPDAADAPDALAMDPAVDPGPCPGPASLRGGTAVILDVSTRGPGPQAPSFHGETPNAALLRRRRHPRGPLFPEQGIPQPIPLGSAEQVPALLRARG